MKQYKITILSNIDNVITSTATLFIDDNGTFVDVGSITMSRGADGTIEAAPLGDEQLQPAIITDADRLFFGAMLEDLYTGTAQGPTYTKNEEVVVQE